ncbi:MAG: hypothetical protein DI533_00570 [Cereibacter sphaeroides]|uniref:Uncharacterized protein n=1 Tax=Cereibacter sphaeroides TaxID=1063 RepID=A0A2W5SHI6_CERSP|nr:MAG: hypothetical protein DI533_00570 [Cereibacter sphaeroides]
MSETAEFPVKVASGLVADSERNQELLFRALRAEQANKYLSETIDRLESRACQYCGQKHPNSHFDFWQPKRFDLAFRFFRIAWSRWELRIIEHGRLRIRWWSDRWEENQ